MPRGNGRLHPVATETQPAAMAGALWLGFSAERQKEFDLRWPHMKILAERGYLVFVSIAPMIGSVTLPDDFLALGRWVIVGGEQRVRPRQYVHPMDVDWARNLRDQCVAAGIKFFMKQMADNAPIPPDLFSFMQFPSL